jgi:hypothetical protein
MHRLAVPVALLIVVHPEAAAQSQPDTTSSTLTSAQKGADTNTASAQTAKVYFDFQVDVPAKRLDNSYAPYPQKLFPKPGCVLVRVLVASTGRVVPESVKVLNSTDPLFTKEVLKIMPRVKYLAAELRGQTVNQWADLRFSWSFGPPISSPLVVCR